ncbi:hypothetical protein POPTR_019G014330v4 [Populus trichocarpa]|uniref:Uncharacterized protein n=1 Tax=Populus trichocarpa TaxID=3694 RepID=A0ACC0RK79_POPTR|nr:hypothetical protein POPTR_019G014330v4 [Populus trichocarpa]
MKKEDCLLLKKGAASSVKRAIWHKKTCGNCTREREKKRAQMRKGMTNTVMGFYHTECEIIFLRLSALSLVN